MGSTRLFALGLALALATSGGGLGVSWAAELKGLELRPRGERLQVILDMDAPQIYEISPRAGQDVTITLPKARLPQSFQGTGLPPITTPEGTVKAEVHETTEGLKVTVHGFEGKARGFGVIMRQPTTTANTGLRPPVPAYPRWRSAKTVQVAKAPAAVWKPQARTKTRVPRVALAPKPKPHAVVATKPPVPSKPIVAKAAPIQSRPSQTPPVTTRPEVPSTRVADASPQEGYNFMGQNEPKVVFEAETGDNGKPLTQPAVKSTLAPIPYEPGQYPDTKTVAVKPESPKSNTPALPKGTTQKASIAAMLGLSSSQLEKLGLNAPMVRWGLMSVAMVVGMLLLVGWIAALMMRRHRANQKTQAFLQESLNPMSFDDDGEILSATPHTPATHAKPLISQGAQYAPAFEIPKSTQAQSSRAQAVPPLLLSQPKSVSEAIHQSLAFKNPGFATLPTPPSEPQPAPKAKRSKFADVLDQQTP